MKHTAMLVDGSRIRQLLVAWTAGFLFAISPQMARCEPHIIAIDIALEDKDLQDAVAGEMSAAGFQIAETPNDRVALLSLQIPISMDKAILRHRNDPNSPWIDDDVIAFSSDSTSRRRAIVQAFEILRAFIMAPKELAILPQRTKEVVVINPPSILVGQQRSSWSIGAGVSGLRAQGGLGVIFPVGLKLSRQGKTGLTLWTRVAVTPAHTDTNVGNGGFATTRYTGLGVGTGWSVPFRGGNLALGLQMDGFVLSAQGHADASFEAHDINLPGLALSGTLQLRIPVANCWKLSLAVNGGHILHTPIIRIVGRDNASMRGPLIATSIEIEYDF